MKNHQENITSEVLNCYHCGELCPNSDVHIGDKRFCCNGCKLVYELLKENDLCAYYSISQAPGSSPLESGISSRYQYLDDESVVRQLINFTDGKISKVTFNIPGIHCSSCIWLLENLYRVDAGIIESKVNFLRKELSLSYFESKTSLRAIVEMLSSIGYEPEINLASLQKKVQKSTDKELYLQIGVAGFAFGNIMLLSFPEYLAFNDNIDQQFVSFFAIISIFLALPVFFYSSLGYFRSAINSLKQKSVNMDVPISMGIITLFIRSIYHIAFGDGSGYLDSFSGLVFLLLIGKLFQKKTYDALSFDRDYRSYFPLSATKKVNNNEVSIPLEQLSVGDRILVKNRELIPADAVMIKGPAVIDYSFVTGESTPVEKNSGDIIYAGGMHMGSQIEMEIIKDVSQSYLTQLWNDDSYNKENIGSKITTLSNVVSKYFTFAVLFIALLAAMYWLPDNLTLAINAFTAVLIVACPCALALSTPFTLGNTLRIFGKNKFYLKNVSIIEALAKIHTILFDKTGTLTYSKGSTPQFIPSDNIPEQLTDQEIIWIRSLVKNSSHPLSRRLYSSLKSAQILPISDFMDYPGVGLMGSVEGNNIILGSEQLVSAEKQLETPVFTSQVQVKINDEYRGFFQISHNYRKGVGKMISSLVSKFRIFLLSGDNEGEKKNLTEIFGGDQNLLFNQTPFEKLNFVKKIQQESGKVLMIGDGLNDAGALRQSDVGISISEDINTFTPASDAILDGDQFKYLPVFLKFSRISIRIIIISFLISFFYNIIGLYFAVQGTLSPLIAAILMPASSLTVVFFTIGFTTLVGKKLGLKL
jgi:Cu+-exporting ATPase